jgi:hypothetical protein
MPITRRQFETVAGEALRQAMLQMHAFLRVNRDKAFTEEELRRELLADVSDPEVARQIHPVPISQTQVSPSNIWSPALRTLVELGAAEAKRFDSTLYFAYASEL